MPSEALGLLPFKIVNEPWNEYVIKDEGHDVILRGRLILAKVTRIQDPSDPKRKGIEIAPHQIWITHSPPALRGAASPKLPLITEIPEEQKKMVDVETTKEAWNVYSLPDDKVDLRLKLVISRVYRVPHYYAIDGEPYYLVESAGLSEVSKDGRPAGYLSTPESPVNAKTMDPTKPSSLPSPPKNAARKRGKERGH